MSFRSVRWGSASGLSFFVVLVCGISVAHAQINLIHQEGFNDDGDGTRYTMLGRGYEVLDVGPGMWEHNFNIDVVGLPAEAAEKRAAIVWSSAPIEDDFTEDALMIWDNLIDHMIDGKEAATIGFLPNNLGNAADFLTFHLEDAGHTIIGDLSGGLPDPADIDLVIQTEEGNPTPNTFFATANDTGYAVPLITFNAGNHDDTLISSIGAATTGGPTQVSVVEANQDHPILGGKTGTLNWVDEFVADQPLQGIGLSLPSDAKTLLTYEQDGQTFPALVLVEQGENLLGAFAPIPEGEGFIVGADMNERFPDEAAEFTAEETPRALQLNPVDISGQTGVKVSIDLAATDVDFEAPDFLRVSYTDVTENPAPEDFVELARFDGMAPGVLVNPDLGPLSPNEFTTFTFEIPDEIDSLTVQVEAFSTFPNEVVGIDNIRIFTGEEVEAPEIFPGDVDGDGSVAFADFLVLSANFGLAVDANTGGDFDGDGMVGFPDFLVLSSNFGQSAPMGAAAVPEPTGVSLLGLGILALAGLRRRR